MNAVSESDFQIAIPCYFRLCEVIRQETAKKLLRIYETDRDTLLKNLGETIRTSYLCSEDACRPRVEAFLALFPSAPGHWRGTPPDTVDAMRMLAVAGAQSFMQTLAFSAKYDFQHWGGAMLGVLRLLPSDTLAQQQAALFDQSLKNYADKHGKDK